MKHFSTIVSLLFLILMLLSNEGHAASVENSSNYCAATLSPNLQLHVPILTFDNQSYWADFQYVNAMDFELTNAGLVTDTTSFSDCAPASLSSDFNLHIPVLTFDSVSYWTDFTYAHDSILTLTGVDQTPFVSPAVNYSPLDVGNKWIYSSLVQGGYRNDEIIGTEIINGITTFIKERIEPDPDNYHEKQWLAYDSSSVLLYRIWGNEGADPAIDLSPPVIDNMLSPQVGDTWSMGDFGIIREVLSVNDTVTVPAGTFTNCIKIQETTTSSGKIHLKHYAPGVGMIRDEQPAKWVEELVYANVAAKTYGVAPY